MSEAKIVLMQGAAFAPEDDEDVEDLGGEVEGEGEADMGAEGEEGGEEGEPDEEEDEMGGDL